MKVGGVAICALFGLTIVVTVSAHHFLGLPPVFGMLAGLGALKLAGPLIARRERRLSEAETFDVFRLLARAEWDTLLFFYGVMMCVGALGLLGYLTLASHAMYGGPGATSANVLVGLVSAVLDNIPLMYAVLTMQPDMPLGQWLLITLTTGVGGSLLSIGSAAGVALMGQARGIYTFSSHLRWAPAVAAGYAAAIAVHMLLNRATF